MVGVHSGLHQYSQRMQTSLAALVKAPVAAAGMSASKQTEHLWLAEF
jgi:hypothetical protein